MFPSRFLTYWLPRFLAFFRDECFSRNFFQRCYRFAFQVSPCIPPEDPSKNYRLVVFRDSFPTVSLWILADSLGYPDLGHLTYGKKVLRGSPKIPLYFLFFCNLTVFPRISLEVCGVFARFHLDSFQNCSRNFLYRIWKVIPGDIKKTDEIPARTSGTT